MTCLAARSPLFSWASVCEFFIGEIIMDNEKIIQKIFKDINDKSKNNKDGEAALRPSCYGFSEWDEGTKEFIKFVKDNIKIREIKIVGKDFVHIYI